MTFLRSYRDEFRDLVNEYENVPVSYDRTDEGDEHIHYVKVKTEKNAYGWIAVEENYDGEEDKLRIAHHPTSEIEAMNQLIEKLEENYHKLF